LPISIRELSQLPHLQVSFVAGAGGADRAVSWVHTSDLPNSWEWHGSGELLLSNGTGLPAGPAGQAAFVTRLSGTGASGLALGMGMTGPPVTAELVQRCDELDLPFLTVPFNVPFTAVVRAVASANEQDESRQLSMVARLYELLRQNIGASAGMLDRLGSELGVNLTLVDPETGLSLQDISEPSEFATELVAGFALHGRALPGMLVLRYADAAAGVPAAVAVSVPAERPIALVVVPTRGEMPSTVLLQHAAAGAALEVAQHSAKRERRRREGAELFAQLLDRGLPEAVAERELGGFGLSVAEAIIVALRLPAGDREPLAASTIHTPHLTLLRPPHLLLLMPDVGLSDAIASAPIGRSAPIVTVGRIPEAVGEAVWVLVAEETGGGVSTRFGDNLSMSPRTPSEARRITESILGEILRHDARTGSDLVATLEAFLDCDRSWQRAAEQLGVHKQTLGYRLRKIETLTGQGFVTTADLAQWWLALRAHRMLAAS